MLPGRANTCGLPGFSKGRVGLVRICALRSGARLRLGLRIPLALIIICALQLRLSAKTLTPVKLKVAGHEVSLRNASLFDGREVYVPLESLRAFYATYALNRREDAALVTFADGSNSEIAIARPGSKPMLPLSLIELHLAAEHSLTSGTCDIRAKIVSFAFDGGTLRITTAFPLPIQLKSPVPDRIVLEIPGATGTGSNLLSAADDAKRVNRITLAKTANGLEIELGLAPGYELRAETAASTNRSHAFEFAGSPKPVAVRAETRIEPAVTKEAESKSAATRQKAVQTAGSLDWHGTNPWNASRLLKSEAKSGNSEPNKAPGGGKTGAPAPRSEDRKIADATISALRSVPAQSRLAGALPRSPAKNDESKLRAKPQYNTGQATPVQQPGKPGERSGTVQQDVKSVYGPTQDEGPPTNATPNETHPAKPPATGGRLTDVELQTMDAFHARLKITTSAKAGVTVKLLSEPTRLAVDIPNCAVETEQKDWESEHPFLSGYHAGEGEKPGSARVVIDLAKMVGYKLVPAQDGVVINLTVPRGVGRKLQDLIVVVDPGHGGPKQTGCHTVVNGCTVYEKNITLSIARFLRQLLEDAGVNVLMTRTKDVEVGLSERPGLATDNNADMFVSIHVDDYGFNTSASGSTAYYHADDESSRALAHSIAERVAQVSGLPNRGARSDHKLYTNGLAVLRASTMPATLVETGYLSNSRDRKKLMDQGFQMKVAQAIFDGIRAYFEGALPEDDLSPMKEIVR